MRLLLFCESVTILRSFCKCMVESSVDNWYNKN